MPPPPGRLPKLPIPGRVMFPPPIGRFIPPIADRFIGIDGRVIPPAGRAMPPPPIRPPPPRPRWAAAICVALRIMKVDARAIVDECLNMGYLTESLVWCQEPDRALLLFIPSPIREAPERAEILGLTA
jgi:hypothetical protein